MADKIVSHIGGADHKMKEIEPNVYARVIHQETPLPTAKIVTGNSGQPEKVQEIQPDVFARTIAVFEN